MYTFVIYDASENNFYQKRTNYASDSGLDLCFPEKVTLGPKETSLVNLNVIIKLKTETDNYIPFLMIPRSSIYKTKIRLANSVGLIDKGYNGFLRVPIDNISDEEVTIEKGTRLFQLICPGLETNFTVEVTKDILDVTPKSERSSGGFGSTGVAMENLKIE